MTDNAFGHAAPDPAIQTKAPALKAALQALWAVEKDRSRSTNVRFPHGLTIMVTVFEHNAEKTKVLEAWSYDLPTVIRGRLVATTEEWAHVERESPIQKSEVEWKTELRCEVT